MAVPQGVAHVEAALQLTGRAGERIGQLEGMEEAWQAKAAGQLDTSSELLRGTLDRFYLKTKVCLPFARRCEEEARAVDELLAAAHEGQGGGEQQDADAQARLTAAIEKLAQAARTLDERSLMQGMAIT